MKTILLLSILLIPSLASFGNKKKVDPEEIQMLAGRIRNVLGNDWVIFIDKNRIDLYFCKSYQNDTNFMVQPYNSFFVTEEDLKRKGIDSVAFLPAVNPPRYFDDSDLKKSRQPEGIYHISIKIEKPWNDEKMLKIRTQNDTLFAALERQGYGYLLNSYKEDLRAQVPNERFWKQFLIDYDFYFQRMPYESYLSPNYIFVENSVPPSTYPFYVDKTDSLYYRNSHNNMFHYNIMTMHRIGYALGLKDYSYP